MPKKTSLPAVTKKTADNTEVCLSASALREVSENISLYYKPKISLRQKSLVLLPIDSKTLYVYWSLGDIQAMQPSQSVLEKALTLKFCRHEANVKKTEQCSAVCEIKVDSAQARKKIHLSESEQAGMITASIGQYDKEKEFLPLVTTQAVKIPGTIDSPYQAVAEADVEFQQTLIKSPDTQKQAISTANKKIHYAATIRSGQKKPHK